MKMKTTLLNLLFLIPGYCLAIDKAPSIHQFDISLDLVKKYRDQDQEKQMLASSTKAIHIAESLSNDTSKAKVYIALGNYYYEKNESSVVAYDYYYKAYRAYHQGKDIEKMAKTLLRLAILEKNTRNFYKSKENCFRALELLGNNQTDFSDHLYNNLGIVYGELGDIKNARLYHQKALDIRKENKQEEFIIQSYNNIATAYMENGYLEEAIPFYKKGLSFPVSTLQKYPEEYARLLDNYAHLRFLKGEENVLHDMLKALSIRKECEHDAGILSSYLNLATYYQKLNQYTRSNHYADQTYKKALQTKNYRDALMALELLESNFQSMGKYKIALDYAKEHKRIVDYLANEELKISEKFADIRYASSQKEKENKILKLRNKEQQLQTEKKKNYLYLTLGIFSILLVAGLGYVRLSRLKQKQKEQTAAQEIIQLMFEKQEAAENAKNIEQKRIANDLHDSIAGKLSGLMLKLDTIGESSPQDIKSKIDPTVTHLEDILEELRSIVHGMNEQQVIAISYPLLIRELASQQLSGKTLISSTVDPMIDWSTISNRIKLAIYYIIQQSVRNINEHSQATEAHVQITRNQKIVLLTISDNGTGLKKEITLGMGILGMKKRTQDVGGSFEITSSEKKGTVITIKIPLS